MKGVKVKKGSNYLLNIIIMIILGFVGIISFWCISYNFQFWGTMEIILNLLLIITVIVGEYCCLRKGNQLWMKMSNTSLLILGILLYLVLFGFSCLVRNEGTGDYKLVYDSALAFIYGEEVDWTYFSRFGSNVPLLYFLIVCGMIGKWMGLTDVYYAILACNIFLVLLTIVSIYYIVGYYNQGKRYLQFFSISLFLCFLPLWGGLQFMYGEVITLVYGVGGIACYLKAKKGTCFWAALAGFSILLGILIRPTSIICVIAFMIIEIIVEGVVSNKKSRLLVLGISVVGLLLYHIAMSQHVCRTYDEEYKIPLQFLFALGMVADGDYDWEENQDFILTMAYTGTYEEKVERSNQYIIDNWREFYHIERLETKAWVNFADGTFGLRQYQYFPGLGYRIFHPFGQFGQFVARHNIIYFYTILILGLCVLFLQLFRKIQDKNMQVIVWGLTILGFMIFMMFWESNEKQIFNQMPCIALLGAFSMEESYTLIYNRMKKKG